MCTAVPHEAIQPYPQQKAELEDEQRRKHDPEAQEKKRCKEDGNEVLELPERETEWTADAGKISRRGVKVYKQLRNEKWTWGQRREKGVWISSRMKGARKIPQRIERPFAASSRLRCCYALFVAGNAPITRFILVILALLRMQIGYKALSTESWKSVMVLTKKIVDYNAFIISYSNNL